MKDNTIYLTMKADKNTLSSFTKDEVEAIVDQELKDAKASLMRDLSKE